MVMLVAMLAMFLPGTNVNRQEWSPLAPLAFSSTGLLLCIKGYMSFTKYAEIKRTLPSGKSDRPNG
jgi:hypothetical protein